MEGDDYGIKDTDFSGNTASEGGGIIIYDHSNQPSKLSALHYTWGGGIEVKSCNGKLL